MPRRDVVLTGIIAFAAGCAVGANWPKIRKKIGPMIGKAGFQISELGEFLSESFPESEAFFKSATNGHAANPFAEATVNGKHPGQSPKNGVHRHENNGRVKPSAKGKTRKKVFVRSRKRVVVPA